MRYSSLDKAVQALESRFGATFGGVIIALALMAGAAIYVRPAVDCVALGRFYAELANNPFHINPENPVGYRLLTPLISYLIGLRGENIIVTNLASAAVLLFIVYRYFRANTPHPGDALLAAAALAFSLVTLTTVYYGGYTDSLTYVLIFLMWMCRARPMLMYALFFAALLNREAVVFLLPWLVYLRVESSESASRTLIGALAGFGCVVGIYWLYRNHLVTSAAHGYDLAYYIDPLRNDTLSWLRHTFGKQGLGWFSVFKLMWVFVLVGLVAMWRNGMKRELLGLALLLIGTWSQIIFAVDSSRLFTLAFMVMPICLMYLMIVDVFEFRRWAPWVVLLNLVVPQLYTASKYIEVMHSSPVNLLLILFFGKESW